MRIAVIGAGSWGTAVACLAAQKHGTVLWARRPEVADRINEERRNEQYLPGAEIPYSLTATSDLEAAVKDAELIVMGVPSHGFREVLARAAAVVPAGAAILSLSKGIEQGTLMRMTEVTAEELPDHDPGIIGVLSGPNLAREVIAGQPAATVIAMTDTDRARSLQEVFMSPSFRVYTNTDVTGCEIAGALKNVMAIAAGMARGLGFGDNTLATLLTRALAELTRLGVAMGGEPLTFAGLAGMGDLIATCVSSQSRNNRVGVELGKGRSLDEIISEMNMVAEGVKTTRAVLDLAVGHGIEMPIANQVGRVLYEGARPRDVVLALMTRVAKSES
ncbi:MAG: NAD(P)-dependent glycerol-3-phosphate dehydrogenase [Acidimicrobiia bacterium]|nr:NAD(P)-dependent glycerol-3-phosphate dehydrogenase [Acidimicrobiia bacterium]MDH3397422.1 NAD(P)-dependent glycerol-3-phosphate dehydrogenase [Acidimicrobiia bacterium]